MDIFLKILQLDQSQLNPWMDRSHVQYIMRVNQEHTPMIAFSSCMVTCFALSTAAATCCWCCQHTQLHRYHDYRCKPV